MAGVAGRARPGGLGRRRARDDRLRVDRHAGVRRGAVRDPAEAEAPFGLGLMMWALDDRPELFDAAVAAAPALVSVSFGDPRRRAAAAPGSP